MDLAEIKPKPLPPRHHAFKGEVSRIILEALRQSTKPLTSADLTLHLMEARGLNTADKRHQQVMVKRADAALKHHGARGLVASSKGPVPFLLWKVLN